MSFLMSMFQPEVTTHLFASEWTHVNQDELAWFNAGAMCTQSYIPSSPPVTADSSLNCDKREVILSAGLELTPPVVLSTKEQRAEEKAWHQSVLCNHHLLPRLPSGHSFFI